MEQFHTAISSLDKCNHQVKKGNHQWIHQLLANREQIHSMKFLKININKIATKPLEARLQIFHYTPIIKEK